MGSSLTSEGAGDAERPMYDLLKSITTPADLRLLERSQLPRLANELRQYLVESVSQTPACPAESKMTGLVFRLLPV